MNSRNSLSHQSDVFRQLRLPLIVLVTYAHSYGAVAEDYHLLTSDWNTYEFLKLLVSQTLVKVAVPVFFILSGYLFFANVKEWNLQVYRRKLLRRVRTLLVPYLFWNMLMAVKLSPNLHSFNPSLFWNYIVNAGCQIDWFGNEHLLTAPVNMPLWFLRDLMVVSVLTPIIYVAVRRLGLWLMLPLTVLYLSGICPFIPGLSAYAVYFFTFGAFFAIRRMPLLDALQRVEIPAYVLSLVFAVAMMLTYHTVVFSSLMLAFRLTGAVAVCRNPSVPLPILSIWPITYSSSRLSMRPSCPFLALPRSVSPSTICLAPCSKPLFSLDFICATSASNTKAYLVFDNLLVTPLSHRPHSI